jgi:type II secretory pathway pseudopilin PulG
MVRTPRPAYTLFELMLVLVLLILLAAIAYPSLDSLLATFRMNAAADMVRANWADARAYAMNEGQPYRFAIIPNKGNFRVAPDNPDYWSSNVPSPTDPNNPPLVVDDSLPKGVRFATTDSYQTAGLEAGDSTLPAGTVDPNSYTTIVTFLPDGTTKDDVEIIFTGAGVRPLDIKLRALTGAVTVQQLQPQ